MDKRLIFRYRTRTIKSVGRAGWEGSSVALELRRLSPQIAPSGVIEGWERGAQANQFDRDSPPRKASAGKPCAPVPQTDTGGRA